MKKLLTLVLCWFIAFSAMAETTLKAQTALSAAGGYITSQNKVDGSFEDEITSWSASIGTIVKTASTEMQGNNIGVWSGTGVGTLDLQWTATASNTFEGTAQVNTGGEDDVYVCAYVGTTETGCKLIPAKNEIQKVSIVANSVLSSAWHLRLKHTGSDAFSIKVDDAKIEPWNLQNVQTVEQESVSYKGTGLLSTTGTIRLPSSGFSSTPSKLYTYSQTTGGFTSLSNATITISATLVLTASGSTFYIYKNSVLVQTSSSPSAAGGYQATAAATFNVKYGDIITIYTSSTVADNANNTLTITATGIRDNVVQSYSEDRIGETLYSINPTAPNGYIPAMGQSIGKASGTYQGDAYLVLYKVAWNYATTTAGEPYVISSVKGASAQADFDAGKTITIDKRGLFVRTVGGNSGAVGAKQLDAFQGHKHTSSTRIGYGPTTGAGANGPPYNANMSYLQDVMVGYSEDSAYGIPRVANETRSINTAEYAYVRYAQSMPTLLALPVSKENVFSAKVSGGGVVTSKNLDWIDSVGVTDTSLFTIDISKLGLTVAPEVSVSANTTDTGGNVVVNVSSVSATSIQVRTGYSTTVTPFTKNRYDFEIKIQKQSPDYTAPGVFVGSLAKDYTAYVDSTETITNATDNFITSCTNADPTVCSFSANRFGVAPYCNAQKTSSADVYVTTASPTSVTIERSDASSPFSLFCQIK